MSRIAPTRLGWKGIGFVLLLTAAWFATPYSNLFFLLLSFLFCIGTLSWFWARANIRGVRGSLEDHPPFPAGRPLPLRLFLYPGQRPSQELSVQIQLADGGKGRTARVGGVDYLDGSITLEGRVPALPRGVHELLSVQATSTFPLGIFCSYAPLKHPERFVVYPEPLEFAHKLSRAELMEELQGREQRQLSGAQPSGLREFRTGDERRSIHWKASARRGDWVVREWDADLGDGIEVRLDRRADPEDFEEALSVLCSLTLKAQAGKDRISVHSQGLSRNFGEGSQPYDDLLLWLAGIEVLPADAPAPPACSPEALRLPIAGGLLT
jgi:uncharacterized protein (DUF58 family)